MPRPSNPSGKGRRGSKSPQSQKRSVPKKPARKLPIGTILKKITVQRDVVRKWRLREIEARARTGMWRHRLKQMRKSDGSFPAFLKPWVEAFEGLHAAERELVRWQRLFLKRKEEEL